MWSTPAGVRARCLALRHGGVCYVPPFQSPLVVSSASSDMSLSLSRLVTGRKKKKEEDEQRLPRGVSLYEKFNLRVRLGPVSV